MKSMLICDGGIKELKGIKKIFACFLYYRFKNSELSATGEPCKVYGVKYVTGKNGEKHKLNKHA